MVLIWNHTNMNTFSSTNPDDAQRDDVLRPETPKVAAAMDDSTPTNSATESGAKNSEKPKHPLLLAEWPPFYNQLIDQCQDIILTSNDFVSFRNRLDAEIASVRATENFSTKIGCQPMPDSIYDESVELVARSYLLFLTRYTKLRSTNAKMAREFARQLLVAVASNIDTMQSAVITRNQTEEVPKALWETFRLQIQRAQHDAQEAKKELAQALDSFAESPKTKAREVVITIFLRALSDAESDAREACIRYEHAKVVYKGVEMSAKFRSPLSPLPELGFYTPRDFASRHDIGEPAVRRHLRNALAEKKLRWATEETLYAGGNWMIFKRGIAEEFDKYLRSKTRKSRRKRKSKSKSKT